MKVAAVILAAGLGKRMESSLPKVLHEVAEKPMISIILETLRDTPVSKSYVITGYGADLVQKEVSEFSVECLFQRAQLGTGHAVSQILDCPDFVDYDYVLILCGDVPLLTATMLTDLIDEVASNQVEGALLGCDINDPYGYGRVVQDENSYVHKVVEEKVATLEEKKISRINSGIYCFKRDALFEALKKLPYRETVQEMFLTDIFEIFYAEKKKVKFVLTKSFESILGVNSKKDLAFVNTLFQKRYKKSLMEQGVCFVDPDSSYVALDVEIGEGVTVEKGAVIHRGSKILPGTVVKAFSNVEKYVTI
ncbi:hypothetical protein AB834_06805 [PVC group bacterium (ex Bugula neritina AB1)]|nr:hypothetical protein AB834_06805 [PVC group bacterium (ex Bugula neritina AB1)]